MLVKWLNLIQTAPKHIKLTWDLLQDNRVPFWQKVIPFLPLIYILSPLNFLSFALPVLGQIDDIMLILLAMELFERVADKRIVQEYK